MLDLEVAKKQLGQIISVRDTCNNEADTKQHMIIPFLRMLNLDRPAYLKLEYTCFSAGGKSEAVDYAIVVDGNPLILIECKQTSRSNLDSYIPQIKKYYQNKITVKIGVLTNGIVYHFFTDNTNTNVMDDEPFLTYDIAQPEIGFDFIKLLYYDDKFDIEKIHSKAKAIWESKSVEASLSNLFSNLPDDLIKFVMKKVNPHLKPNQINLSKYKAYIQNALDTTIEKDLKEPDPVPGEIAEPITKNTILVYLNARGVNAQGKYDPQTNNISVLKGSEFAIDEVPSCSDAYRKFRKRLIADGYLKINKAGDKYILQSDLGYFASSTAGAYVLGRSVNGWTIWKDKNSDKTLKELMLGK